MNQSITSGSIRYYKILSETDRPVYPARAIGAVVDRIFRRLLLGLHESRRRQAAQIIERHRHLIADADAEPEAVPHRGTPPKNRR